MKTIMTIFFMLGLYAYASAQDMPGMNMNKKDTVKPKTKIYYTCVMHPEIHASKPGNCPKCGMKLVKKTVKVTAAQRPVHHHNEMKVKKDTTNVQDSSQMDMNMNMNDTTKENKGEMDMRGMDDEMKTNNEEAAKVIMGKGRTVRYDLYVRDSMVNFTGKLKHAYVINGSIPAPTLVFTEGDTAEIYLHNELKREETSLHWHGVILPNQADGVPYLTTTPIHPGETHLYKFAVVQNGTYWYHAHTALQEQAGMYGALIFKKKGAAEMNEMENTDTHSSTMNASSAKNYTLVLSEWSDENPTQIQRRLRTGNDWYSIKKASTQSYAEAIKEGNFGTKLTNEWKRMKAMDVSDVYYEKFLTNGKPENAMPDLKAGDKMILHVVNAGASSYFWLQYAGGKITVVGNDGNDVVPVEVDRLIIAPAETYDLVVTVPQNMSYEFRATSEDRTNATSLWLGSGMKMNAPVLQRLKYFEGMKMMNDMMKVNGDMKDMGMQMSLQQMDMNSVMYPEITGSGEMQNHNGHDMNNMKMENMENMKMDSTKDMKMSNMTMDSTHQMKVNGEENKKMNNMNMGNMQGMDMSNSSSDIVTLNYSMLRSPVKTTLPDAPTKVLHFTLTGNMIRYVWSINNKTVNEWDKILINQGENVRIILTNNSMMRHPMHLHGHDFRVLNGQGEYAPLKNVIDIMPMETDTIEFAGNKTGNWFFHCHILFHMMGGMGNVLRYANSPANPELPDSTASFKSFKRDNTMDHLMARIGLESNGSDGEIMLSSNRFALQQIWHLGYHPEHGYESETNFGRFFGKNQFLFPYIGFDYHYKKTDGDIKDESDYKNLFGQVSDKNNRHTLVAGVQYLLPSLIVADARVDLNGKFRFQLSREDVPVTRRLRFNFMANTDKEYALGLRYIVSKWLAVSTHYDSDMGLGGGVTITY